MKYIIGIGNPGKKYDGTRHNVGFEVIDALKTRLKGSGVKLLKPDTFVNRTGDVVREKKIEASDLLIVCDDVNLVFGKMRLKPSGSAGGHHGLESVIEALNSEEFARLRIGVGNASMPKDLTGFVLEPFNSEEKKRIQDIVGNAASICEAWAKAGFEDARVILSQLQSSSTKE